MDLKNKELENLLGEFRHKINQAESLLSEYCCLLKNQIRLSKEKFTQELDKSNKSLTEKVDAYHIKVTEILHENEAYVETTQTSINSAVSTDLSLVKEQLNNSLKDIDRVTSKFDRVLSIERSKENENNLSSSNLLNQKLLSENFEEEKLETILTVNHIDKSILNTILLVEYGKDYYVMLFNYLFKFPSCLCLIDKHTSQILNLIHLETKSKSFDYFNVVHLAVVETQLLVLSSESYDSYLVKLFDQKLRMTYKVMFEDTHRVFIASPLTFLCEIRSKNKYEIHVLNSKLKTMHVIDLRFLMLFEFYRYKNFAFCACNERYYIAVSYENKGVSYSKLYVFTKEKLLGTFTDFDFKEKDLMIIDQNENLILYNNKFSKVSIFKVTNEIEKLNEISLIASNSFDSKNEYLELYLNDNSEICLFNLSSFSLFKIKKYLN